ncbi:MAG: peptide chain release factor N(5)-glutamine methyltransferase [Desulfosarcinaceae bacterium]|nr:peptide chain release factor N(5)-glutamine methyltransferase [Desulfosarcinaceae bacterium]
MSKPPEPPAAERSVDRKTSDAWTVLTLLRWTAGYFEKKGVEAPRAGAELLLAHCLGVGRLDLYLQYDRPLSTRELGRFKELIRRRAQGEPVAYITGGRAFWTLDLMVNPEVLIPRPETERLVEIALQVLRDLQLDRPRVLDLGTGSGAIVLALAAEFPNGYFVALDRSLGALQTARENQTRNAVTARIDYLSADWCTALRADRGGFDLIVSNPPYIASGEMDALQIEVRRFEPRAALEGGADGLSCLRRIVRQAATRLVPGGHLIMEIGADQADQVIDLATAVGRYECIDILKDYAGLMRVAHLRCGEANLI